MALRQLPQTAGTCDSNGGVEFTYASPITITTALTTETVMAIGTLAANINSATGSAAYTITPGAVMPNFGAFTQ
jgi:hypothetical protein